MARNFLTRSRHGTVYYFRRRVPDDLRPAIAQPYLIRSLGTSERSQAIILARAYAAQTDIAFTRLRTMSDKKLTAQELLDNFANLPDCRDRIRRAGMQLRLEEAERERERLEREVVDGLCQQQEQQKRHARDLEVAIMAGAARSTATPPPAPAPSITAEELFEDFLGEGIASNRWRDAETTRTRDYGPIWKRFAVHASKHGLTVAAAKAYRAEVMSREQDSAETKKRNLYRVHAVMEHGVSHHDLDARILSHLKAPKGKRSGGSKVNSYLPFTDDELRLLFHSEFYKENSFKKASQFWLPMLGLYTGARLEELAGLHLVSFSTVDGFPSMRLSDHDTTDEGKNEFAPREVPIHPELIKAGLLDYVESLRAEGHERLFPEIGAAARDGFAKRATTDFTKYRRSVGVGKDEGERSRKVFHSFRSTLAGKLFPLTADDDLRRRLLGHAARDVHAGTYLGAIGIPMERATEVMSRVSFGLQHPEFSDTAAYKKARNRKPRSPKS
jgi:hypothetical protein